MANKEVVDRLKKQMINMDCVRFNMNIPRKIHRQFQSIVAAEGKKMSGVMMDNILKYIEKHK